MYISIHRCCSVLCWTTFGRSCSIKCFWVWLYKLGTSIFRQSFTLFFAKPLKLQHVIVGIVSTQLFSDLSRDVWSGNRHSQSGPLCSHSFINLAVCLRSLSWWKMSLCPVRGPECSEHCCTLLYSPENHPHSMMLPPEWFTAGNVLVRWWPVRGSLQAWCSASRPKSLILASSDQRILFLTIWDSFRCRLANSRGAVMCILLRSGFCLAPLPYRPYRWGAAEVVVIGALPDWPSGSWSPDWLRAF